MTASLVRKKDIIPPQIPQGACWRPARDLNFMRTNRRTIPPTQQEAVTRAARAVCSGVPPPGGEVLWIGVEEGFRLGGDRHPIGPPLRRVHSGFHGDMGAGWGMLVVETIGKIRRAYFIQKKPIKVICRAFRLSRKVVRKVIRSEATEFHYERGRQPLPRIDPWREQLDGVLLANESKPRRERLTLMRVFEELRGLGYQGGYDSVRRYAKAWRVARGAVTAEAYVPLSFAPGEAYQFDRSHEIVLINGTTVTVKVAHFGCATAGCRSCEPIRARPRRWCSTRTTGPLLSSRGPARAASMTT